MSISRGTIAALAGVVGAGVLAFPVASAAFGDGDTVYKRDDRLDELVLVDEDDDADDDTNATNTANTATGATQATGDDSRHTNVSRDDTRDNTNANTNADTRDDTNSRDDSRDDTNTRGDDSR